MLFSLAHDLHILFGKFLKIKSNLVGAYSITSFGGWWSCWISFSTYFSSQGCRPTRIWSIIRHGTRNPSEKVILRAQTRLAEIKEEILKQSNPNLCAGELKKLRKWSWNFLNAAEDEKLLVAEGEDELTELAERMQNRFPSLLPDMYDPGWYFFKYTATQRTLKSAESFATGLFGRHRIHAVRYPPPLHQDPILRVSTVPISRLYTCFRIR